MTLLPLPGVSAVEAADLRHSYGRTPDRRIPTLHGISLVVHRGELFGLLGPNGSGKSTLIRILATMIAPESGSCRIMGRDPVTDAPGVRSVLGVTFQHPALDKKLTVAENLYFHGRLYGMTAREIASRSGDLMDKFGLEEYARRQVETLSGGMQRRVELAKALLPGPSVLLLDEPTNGLDPNTREDFFNLIASERSQTGMAVLFSTHILDDAERCDRLTILDGGRAVASGSPASLKSGLGKEIVTIETTAPEVLAERLRRDHQVFVADGRVGILCEAGEDAAALLPELNADFGELITGFSCSKPTLGDLFARITGRPFSK